MRDRGSRWPCCIIVTVALTLSALHGCASVDSPAQAGRAASPATSLTLSRDDDALLEDLSKRSFMFFWEQADPDTGLVRDRARTTGVPVDGVSRDIASIASVGFGLAGLCVANARGWVPPGAVTARARATLRFLADRMPHERGWFYHFVNLHTGAREWSSEVSSIDTALLLAGVLTVGQCLQDDEVSGLAARIYQRVDFRWMLAGDARLLSHGWKPETGFLPSRWDRYSELMVLYVLAIGSPAHGVPPESWHAWQRPVIKFGGYTYVGGPAPLFVHQYSHAWVDFRGLRERQSPHIDWWQNSVDATHAHRAFCRSLSSEFPGYDDDVWGITASDSRQGYVAWGGPPRDGPIDGTVVPCAAAGSLMLAPEVAVPAVRTMHARFGAAIYGRYGFADAFHPANGWVNPDVIGIDVGITLLSAENLRTGRVWRWFMANREIPPALERAGLTRAAAAPVTLSQWLGLSR